MVFSLQLTAATIKRNKKNTPSHKVTEQPTAQEQKKEPSFV